MNESQTRHDLIDPALAAAGWNTTPGSKIRVEVKITAGRLIGRGKREKPLYADYVLRYKNRDLLVIEAKKRQLFFSDGKAQAVDYARRLDVRYAVSTNGDRIYLIDTEDGKESEINAYPTPEELWFMTFPVENALRDELTAVPFEDRGGTWQPRYYQQNAVLKAVEAISAGRRRLLLTLATGTGKTAIAFQIAWKLFQSKWNLIEPGARRPRILFLADRNILANQAFNSFGAFDEDALVRISPADIRKRGKVPTNGSVFFTIFQTFMSGPDDSPYFGDYDRDFFDFIIIDECHRGGANDESSWRDIMEHFEPAVQLGLTATPKRDVNRDTYRYFGDPIYIYSLKEGINDGFLTPFRVKEIQTNMDDYVYTSDDTVLSGQQPEAGKVYGLSEQNRSIELEDVEKYKVRLFMQAINQRQKTLVFCATQAHAAAVRDYINQFADSSNVEYCCRVTADDGAQGEKYLRFFQDNEKTIPTVLTTSQKLSTGVDAKEVRNIVLLRPVNSMVEFKQIVGRGTRLFDGKDYFTIFDFVGAHAHFQDAEWDGPPLPPAEPPGTPPAPRTCTVCGLPKPCGCAAEPQPCPVCGEPECICDAPPRAVIRIKLSDRKVMELDSMTRTTFWSPDGKPISAREFLQQLYGDLPALFENEAKLREIWSAPLTRQRLLEELEERGYNAENFAELKRLVKAEDSDLFDVLTHIAYERDLVPRSTRAERAKVHLHRYDKNRQDFLNFVLEQYTEAGHAELALQKLPDLLVLKYEALQDAKRVLGTTAQIRDTFSEFQEYLYAG